MIIYIKYSSLIKILIFKYIQILKFIFNLKFINFYKMESSNIKKIMEMYE
jgi:hypothetical protein